MKKQDLLNLKNVIGHYEDKDKVTVLVTEKVPIDEIFKRIVDPKSDWKESDVIPKSVKTGLFNLFKKDTDVIGIGEVKIHADRKRYRPIQPGCEIGPKNIDWVGTLGLIVKTKYYNGLHLIGKWHSFITLLERFKLISTIQSKVCGLTNLHVVSKDVTMPQKCFITQPGYTASSQAVIGYTLNNEPINPEQIMNDMDAALVYFDASYHDTHQFEPDIISIGKVNGIDDVKIDDDVYKYGRTTKLTEGKCTAKNVNLYITYPEIGNIYFTGIDMFTGMSDAGDSGSCIVRKSDNKAVSLLFAGSGSTTFGIPIKKVQDRLKFELW